MSKKSKVLDTLDVYANKATIIYNGKTYDLSELVERLENVETTLEIKEEVIKNLSKYINCLSKYKKAWKIIIKLWKKEEYINLILDNIKEFKTFNQFKDELSINDEKLLTEKQWKLLKEMLKEK